MGRLLFRFQDDEHFFVVMRYVERNALAARLVPQAEEWRFGGLYNWLGGRCGIKLAKWPVPRLPNWLERVNRVVSEKEEEQLKGCIAWAVHRLGTAVRRNRLGRC